MRKLKLRAVTIIAAGLIVLAPLGVTGVAWAGPESQAQAGEGASKSESGSEGDASGSKAPDGSKPDNMTSILPNDMDIEGLLKLILNIIVYGLGAAATLGVIIAGIMYMTARDNEAQVAKAKTRLFEVVIGLVAWALMYVVLNWLIPGGLNLS